MKKIVALLTVLLIGIPLIVLGQSLTPQCAGVWYYGSVPTAGQINTCIAFLQPLLGYTPLNKAGDTMLGALGITQLFGVEGPPTVAAGAGAGTSPTITLAHDSDSDFELTVQTGTSPSASAIIATVTFLVAYSNTPNCVFSPDNAAAAGLMATGAYPYASRTTSTWVLNSEATALTGSTAYKWAVVCMGANN